MARDEPTPQQSLGDLLRLTKDYAVQETVDPIKGLAKFIGYGLAAATVGSVALTLILLGILRLIQRETGDHLTGHLTWIPYLVTMLIAVVAMAIAVASIAAKKGKTR